MFYLRPISQEFITTLCVLAFLLELSLLFFMTRLQL